MVLRSDGVACSVTIKGVVRNVPRDYWILVPYAEKGMAHSGEQGRGRNEGGRADVKVRYESL